MARNSDVLDNNARNAGESYEEWLIRRARETASATRGCTLDDYPAFTGALAAWATALADALEIRRSEDRDECLRG